MRLLAIETATDTCSIAIASDTAILVEQTIRIPRKHSEFTTTLIQHSFQIVDFQLQEIDAIAVSIGPGSFTGLRIGLSTAKGLMFQTDTTLLSIPTLTTSAWGFRHLDTAIAVVHHSHGEFYFYALFQSPDDLNPDVGPVRVPFDKLQNLLPPDVPVIAQVPAGNQQLSSLRNTVITTSAAQARFVAEMAVHTPERWGVEKPYALEPDYLREYQAAKYENPLH